MAHRHFPHPDIRGTNDHPRCPRPYSPLRVLCLGGVGSVFFDAVRFIPPFLSGRLPTWDDNIGRQAHLPMLVGVTVFCIVAYALLAGLWVKAVGRAGEDVT